ncbi:DUF2304 domain-containing protein [Streptococcus ruminantium]|nr:DUF2304 domain-containing protein [Streptococcus ruminantium]
MAIQFQFLLIVTAMSTSAFILMNIRKSRIQIEDSIFLVFFFSGVLLVFAFLPNAISQLSDWIGIESPANFVFLAIIFLLIVNQYRMTLKQAKLEIKLKELIQFIAINKK